MIVEHINLYAYQCMGDTAFEAWQKVTAAELEAFFGFMILMGIVRLPSLLDYWNNDVIFHYIPVASRIYRNRFFDLQKYLHFADNTSLVSPGCEGYNKLGKIQPILDMLTARFEETYNHGREVSIDEAMVPFKGRFSMKQYLLMKPVKRGFKVWVLADGNTGYISRLNFNTGKTRGKSEDGLEATVVKTLCENLKHRYVLPIFSKR